MNLRYVLRAGLAVVCLGPGRAASADGAVRQLPRTAPPGGSASVSITLDPPPETVAAGVEDTPPPGWVATSITEGGVWDASLGKVKWGPYLAPSIPAVVSYEVTVPVDAAGSNCFSGSVSFGGPSESVTGDECLFAAVPVMSDWGVVIMVLLVLAAASSLLLRDRVRRTAPSTGSGLNHHVCARRRCERRLICGAQAPAVAPAFLT